MFGFKILVIAFVVITITQHVISDDEYFKTICRTLFASESWFYSGYEDGHKSFKNNFSYMTASKINNIFAYKGGEETPKAKTKRLIKQTLFSDYFHNLLVHNEINDTDVILPETFCKESVNKFVTNNKLLHKYPGSIKELNSVNLLKDCIEYTRTRLNINYYYEGSSQGIIKCLYEVWTKDLMTYERITGEPLPSPDNQTVQHKIKQFYISYFTQPYFDAIKDIIDKTIIGNEKGKFWSVRTFCDTEGFQTVKNYMQNE